MYLHVNNSSAMDGCSPTRCLQRAFPGTGKEQRRQSGQTTPGTCVLAYPPARFKVPSVHPSIFFFGVLAPASCLIGPNRTRHSATKEGSKRFPLGEFSASRNFSVCSGCEGVWQLLWFTEGPAPSAEKIDKCVRACCAMCKPHTTKVVDYTKDQWNLAAPLFAPPRF